jgi:hypothetical protein
MIDKFQRGESIKETDDVLDENGKPFWMKFMKPDYLGETKPLKITEEVKEETEKDIRMRKEMEKIRRLGTKIA